MTASFFRTLARDAAASYPRGDRFARHFASGKLKGDPAFSHLLRSGLVNDGARMLDLGSGQGLLPAILHAARARHAGGDWPADWPTPPAPLRYTGIELMAGDVARARAMVAYWTPTLPAAAHTSFIEGDIRTTEFPHADVVTILDVLHYIDYEAQAAVLARVRSSLGTRGVLLMRVGDLSTSLRFRYTVFIDRLVMRLRGHSLPRLWCRPAAEWRGLLEKHGFAVEAVPMSAGTPFANVLLVARL